MVMPRGGWAPITTMLMALSNTYLKEGTSLVVVKEGEKRVTYCAWMNWVNFNLLLSKVVKSSPIIRFFLRCDWSSLRLRKLVVFPNLICMVKNLDSWIGSLVMCGEGVRHTTTPIKRQSFCFDKILIFVHW